MTGSNSNMAQDSIYDCVECLDRKITQIGSLMGILGCAELINEDDVHGMALCVEDLVKDLKNVSQRLTGIDRFHKGITPDGTRKKVRISRRSSA